ncbi:MAG: DNA translocase FtsK 4TM domain-containing protein [Candidatus Saccharimonadales bacterium]
MAQKKKSTKSRKAPEPTPSERNPFWAYAGAIILILLATFMLIGGFGTGGSLPTNLFHSAYWAFGWMAYLVPGALAYWGVMKFASEEKQAPLSKLTSLFVMLMAAAAWAHVAFASKDFSNNWMGGHGGAVGRVVGNAMLDALDKIPASLLFFIVTTLAALYSFGISPKSAVESITGLFQRPEREDEESSDLGSLKAKAGFKLNAGVPVESHSAMDIAGREAPKLTSMKNTAQKLTASENHEALTTARDADWQFPSMTLLNQKQDKADAGDVNANAKIIHDTFGHFKINVEMEGANIGPRVTQYTMKPPSDVKLTKITALENNLALDLAAHSIRMEAPIPGQRAVGIEVPNIKAATVRVASLLSSKEWSNSPGPLSFVIGKDIAGLPIVADLAKMPHLLVAGQTGSGKSVMINTFITSLLYRNSPSDLKLILVDPKQVEMAPYQDLPHLLTPVINDPEKCISALKWAVAEMERRLRTMAGVGKRNISEYNLLKQAEGMPYIVIVIDELADLMMMAARDVESLIVRLAQKARAAGIHLVLATQRPSVDVITGLIKANVPARIAFTVASQIDSRTIIDQMGAEKLLGRGDMLLLTSDMAKPKRVQAALIEDDETAKITEFIRMQRPPQYDDEIISQPVQIGNGKGGVVADFGGQDADDDMFRDAVRVVIENKKASTSLLQRRLRIGYGRAARVIEQMEEQGIIGAADGSRPREVLVSSLDEVFGGASGDDEVPGFDGDI